MSNHNQLKPTNRAGLTLSQYSPEKLQVIKNTVAKGATDDELEMFLTLASRYNLDPFMKEIWFIKRAKKAPVWRNNKKEWDYKRLPDGSIDYSDAETVIMSSRDGYLKAARDTPGYIGLRSAAIKEGDDFSYNPVTQEIKHIIGTKRGKVTGAWAIARREEREDIVEYVDFQEYKEATGGGNYDKYPSAMIKKVAEVLALKRQFGLNGLVTQEEMSADYSAENAAASNIIDYKEPERIEAGPATQPQQRPQQDPQQRSGSKSTSSDDVKKKDWLKLAEKVRDLRDELGIDQETLNDAAARAFNISSNPADWTLKQIRQVKNWLEEEIKKISRTSTDDEKLIEEFERTNP